MLPKTQAVDKFVLIFFWKRLHLPAICLACEIKLIGYFYRRDRPSASIRYKWMDRNKYIYYFVFRSIVELLEENKIKVQELSMNEPCAKIEIYMCYHLITNIIVFESGHFLSVCIRVSIVELSTNQAISWQSKASIRVWEFHCHFTDYTVNR